MSTQPITTVPSAFRVIATNELITGPPASSSILLSGLLSHSSPSPLSILDNATGGGILISQLLKSSPLPPISLLVAADVSEQMLAYARQRAGAESWLKHGIPSLQILNSNQESPSPELLPESFDYIFNNFGIFFSRSDAATLAETHRLLKPGGRAIFTSWKKIGWWGGVALPALRRAFPEAGAKLPENPLGAMFADAWDEEERARGKLTGAGFRDVRVETRSFSPEVEHEAFAEACAVLVGVVGKRVWTEEEWAEIGPNIERTLLGYLRENYKDGSGAGEMCALVSVGRK